MGYALAQPVAVTFAVFTALALGLAAPYVALTLQPAWTRLLPRPGAWMEVLKQAVSVPIFVTVIWLAWVVAQAYGAALLAALLGELSAAGHCRMVPGPLAGEALGHGGCGADCGWRGGAGSVSGKSWRRAAAGSRKSRSEESAARSAWQPWSADAVQKSLPQGQPVFVDFTASWCLSCQVNERVALSQPEVKQAFQARERGPAQGRLDARRSGHYPGADRARPQRRARLRALHAGPERPAICSRRCLRRAS